jgi:uncharacterized protein (DUF1330 family)
MTNRIGIVVGLIVGFGLGAVSVHSLHAQSKPLVYLINEIDVTDPEGYGKEFAPKAQLTVTGSGARFVAIGGAAGANAKPITAIEGTPPKRMTIQAWDSMESLNKWYHGAAYQEALKIGKKYATFRRYAVEGQ